MKTALALFATLLSAFAFAQANQKPQTLLDYPIEVSGFGGFTAEAALLGDGKAILTGGKGGAILNHGRHGFLLGGAGKATASPMSVNNNEYTLGWGGAMIGYVYRPKALFHVQLDSTIGWGSISNQNDANDQFMAFDFGLTYEANVTEYFQVGLMARYNAFNGISLDGLDENNFSGPSFGMSFEFGKF